MRYRAETPMIWADGWAMQFKAREKRTQIMTCHVTGVCGEAEVLPAGLVQWWRLSWRLDVPKPGRPLLSPSSIMSDYFS
jgi:hypothetical protein